MRKEIYGSTQRRIESTSGAPVAETILADTLILNQNKFMLLG